MRELTTELPGIFNWAYEGLLRLTAAGGFIEPARCKEALSKYRRDTNPAKVFLEENYVARPSWPCLHGLEARATIKFEGVPCGEVYQAYAAWCGQNGYHSLNANNFGKEVIRAFHSVKKSQRRQGGLRITVYIGLAVREESRSTRGVTSRL